jgi:hypothetical protein
VEIKNEGNDRNSKRGKQSGSDKVEERKWPENGII